MYLTTPEMRTPHYSGHCPYVVQIKEVPLYHSFSIQRSQYSVDGSTPNTSHSHTFPTPPNNPWSRGNGDNSPLLPPGGRITSYGDVNVQYLKHVIIKFLCSREDEVCVCVCPYFSLSPLSPYPTHH